MKFVSRINYLQKENFLCCRLGALGFSTRFIEKQTGLSAGQIGYRLRRVGIRRRDYREGVSQIAKWLLDKTKVGVDRNIEERLRPLLKR